MTEKRINICIALALAVMMLAVLVPFVVLR
jgi:hypothetical protein